MRFRKAFSLIVAITLLFTLKGEVAYSDKQFEQKVVNTLSLESDDLLYSDYFFLWKENAPDLCIVLRRVPKRVHGRISFERKKGFANSVATIMLTHRMADLYLPLLKDYGYYTPSRKIYFLDTERKLCIIYHLNKHWAEILDGSESFSSYITKQEREKERKAKLKTVLTVEKKLLLDSSYFGNYINAKKQKLLRPRKVKLNIWEPYYTYMSRIGTFPAAFAGVKDVKIEYDEIWIYKDQRTKELCKFYWLKDKVQAFSLEKIYIGNPLTGGKISPTYKIIELHDRKSIFAELGGK